MKNENMRLIEIMDHKNYNQDWPIIERNAVRAIIRNKNKIALIKSYREGFYKFPGGGIEKGESHIDTLIRETQEETGLIIQEHSVKELGFFVEKRKSLFEEAIFLQHSYYYLADVEDKITETHLEGYEIDLDYRLEWIDLLDAILLNQTYKGLEYSFVERETIVLNFLLKK